MLMTKNCDFLFAIVSSLIISLLVVFIVVNKDILDIFYLVSLFIIYIKFLVDKRRK